MRVSQLDRRRAIKRVKKFQNDHENLLKIEIQEDRTRREIELEREWGFPLESIIRADEVAKQRRNASAVRQVTSISRNPIVKFVSGEGDKREVLFRGDYLYLEIDIQRPDDELQETFSLIIKECKKYLPHGRKKSSKIRGVNSDIWDIYDANNSGCSTQEIIIIMHGKDYDVGKHQDRFEREIREPLRRLRILLTL